MEKLLKYDDYIIEFWLRDDEEQGAKMADQMMPGSGKQVRSEFKKRRARDLGIGAAMAAGAGAIGYGIYRLTKRDKADRIKKLESRIDNLKIELKNTKDSGDKIEIKSKITKYEDKIKELKQS